MTYLTRMPFSIGSLRRLNPMRGALRNAHATPDVPRQLALYEFRHKKSQWTRSSYDNDAAVPSAPTSLRLLTWNVDFMAEQKDERLRCVLGHIQHDSLQCSDGKAPQPCVLLLQEIHASVIPVLLSNQWVRAHFRVTPISQQDWPDHSRYGNITLIARSVPVVTASSLDFTNSQMARNALLVDVVLGQTANATAIQKDSTSDAKRAERFRVRIGNVHLESLKKGTTARPHQLALVANALREPGLNAGLVCGDMNPIMESDKSIPSSVGLSDAFVGGDDDPLSHTWGYQPKHWFPPRRMDKILYTPGKGLLVKEPERVGVGLKIPDGTQFASDHYGLQTIVSVATE